MNRYVFQCREATIAWMSFFPAERILHFKGYASGIEIQGPFPSTITKIMDESDVIVFDGDDLNERSFTLYLTAMAPVIARKNITLVAFKFDHQIDYLKYSWDNRIIEVNEKQEVQIVGDSSAIDDAQVTAIPLHYIEIPHPDPETPLVMSTFTNWLHPNDHLYLYLGKEALIKTGARRVLTIGGGACLVEEYYHSDEDVEWIVYDQPRYKNGKEERTLLLEIDLRNGHERIRQNEENMFLIRKKSLN